MTPKVAIIFYSTYGHIKLIAEAEREGLQKAGIEADIFQVTETLSEDVLTKMHAGPKSNYPIITGNVLETYDAFLFGIPTRFGFWGKYAGLFIAAATQGGGQESTAIAAMSTLAHHGMIYVPLEYKTTLAIQSGLAEIRGGSPWGAGTFTGIDGSRMPSALELELATLQGESFGEAVKKVSFA